MANILKPYTDEWKAALKNNCDRLSNSINNIVVKYKWRFVRTLGWMTVGYYAHMVLTNQTGAALRGAMRVF